MSVSFVLVEISCVLVLALVAAGIGLGAALICLLAPFVALITMALQGFAGVLRAAFWARAYRRMGGATAADHLGGIGATPSQG